MKRHTCWVRTEDAAPVEICSISDSDSVSFMTVSPGACVSFTGASLSITPAGLVSVNSTESATDGVEKSDAEEEALEGMPVSMALILAAQALKGDIALDGTSVFSTGARLRASSPKTCTDLILDVLSAACLLEVALAPFERLSCSMRQSVQACSSSVACSSVALAFQY